MRVWMLSLLLCSASALHAETLRIAVSAGVAAPLAEADGQGACPGLVQDIADAIARPLGWQVHCQALPRERIESALAQGQIDAIAYYRRDWAAAPERLRFSAALFRVCDRVISSPARAPTLRDAASLQGQRVAMLSGFVYPQLTAEVNRGRVRRVDVDRVATSLRLFDLQRVDALVVNEASYRHAQALDPSLASRTALAPWVVAADDIHWAFHAVAPSPRREPALAALQRLAASPELGTLRDFYPGVYPASGLTPCSAPPPPRR